MRSMKSSLGSVNSGAECCAAPYLARPVLAKVECQLPFNPLRKNPMTNPLIDALVASGKSAVEAELSKIEVTLASAKAQADRDLADIAGSLAVHMDRHATEAALAAALLARAQGTKPAAPAPPLSLSAGKVTLIEEPRPGLGSRIEAWFSEHGRPAGMGVCVLIVIYFLVKLYA